MGEALLAGWLRQGLPRRGRAGGRARRRRAASRWPTRHGVRTVAARRRAAAGALAPGDAGAGGQAADDGRGAAGLCAAGWRRTRWCCRSPPASRSPCSSRRSARGSGVVRAMPNTPAAVGRGVTVLCANAAVGRAAARAGRAADGGRRARCTGSTDEELMHAVTAVSGSGPAYVFHLIEALAAAGVRAGLPERAGHGPGARHRGRRRRAGPAVDRDRGAAARQRDQPRRHDRGGAGGADGARTGSAPLLERAVAAAAQRSRELA